MNVQSLFQRSQELQIYRYVGWNDDDTRRVQAVAFLLDPCLHDLIEDIYAEIERHPNARRVITGSKAQIERHGIQPPRIRQQRLHKWRDFRRKSS